MDYRIKGFGKEIKWGKKKAIINKENDFWIYFRNQRLKYFYILNYQLGFFFFFWISRINCGFKI